MIQRLAPALGLCLAFACTSTAAELIITNSTWKLFKGRSEASSPDPAAWRAVDFNDTAWTSNPSPFSYGESAVTNGTFLTDMQNQYTCIFLRQKFVASNLNEIAALRLGAACDDGFIAWVNGTEVARYNMPEGVVPYNGVALTAPAEPVPFDFYTLLNPQSYLVEGTNVLTVQAFNVSLGGSSDFLLNASLASIPVDSVAPTIVSVTPAPGDVNSLTAITVQFSEPVNGVDASDFLINGLAVSTAAGSNAVYTFTFSQPPYGTVSIGWATNHGIFDHAINPNPFDSTAPGASWEYELVDRTPPTVSTLFPAAGVVVRTLTQIEVTFSEEVTGVDSGDLLIRGVAATNLVEVPGGPYIFQFPEPPVGPVSVNWRSGHGITDLAAMPNAFGGGAWSYELNPSGFFGDLVINEFLAANISTNGLADEDREQSDWIEIYNRGTNTVDLGGWSLSDDPDVPGLWVFPSRALAPGQYLVVFASGKDRKNPTGTNRFHTNFRLGDLGEHLGLYSPDSPRALVSGFAAFPEQRNDHSYGYAADGSLRYFRTPTPGAPNGVSAITGVVEPIHFSVERGHFTAPFDLYISTPTPKTTIRYTVDGSEPTEQNGTNYTGPLRIAASTILRAAAFRTNMLPSRAVTHTYLFNQPATIRSLPVISLTTATNNLIGRTGIIGMEGGTRAGDNLYITNNPATDYHNPSAHGLAWERPVSAELIRFDGRPGFQIDCGIRVQGSDYQRPRTTPASKFSFRLYFRSDYGPGRLEYPLFTNTTIAEFDQLVLRAGFNDNANPFIRDELTRRLSADMGAVASHGNLVNLFINGQYKGYYNPCERIHEEMLQAHHGGGQDWDVVGPTFAASSSGFGIIDGDRTAFASLVNFINTQNVLNSAIYQQVTQRLDIVNFVDYCLLNVYCGMGDWPGNNWRAGKDRSGGIWRFYIWDGEWSMGIYSRAVWTNTFIASGPGPHDSGLASTGNSEIAQIYQRLRQNPEFRLLWADRIHKHYFNNGTLMDANILAHFNSLRTEMSAVLPGMATDIPLTWIPQRRGYNMEQFQSFGLLGSSNAPNFSRHGGRVQRNFQLTMTVSNPANAVIYYTTNGTDPRVMFSGAVASSAEAYDPAVGVVMQQSMVVKARTLTGGTNWSALTEARFEVGTIGVPIRITEINYNPPGGNALEFIELKNFGSAALDLTAMTFEGITFTFPSGTILGSGQTIVLSSDLDPNAFSNRYPSVVVAGRFGGSLANGGERLTLKDSRGQVIFTVDFDDENGWPTAADGSGATLELNDPFGDPDDPANWRASAQLHGTPGTVSSPPAAGAVRINELMADNLTAVANGGTYPDWIELHNSGGSAVSLQGWSITDDGNARKYVFGPGTSIPAGGYLVVWCDSLTNTTPGIHTGFALDQDGETISLYNASTSRVDAVSYGLQVTDYSVGRFGAGWELAIPTPNAANTSAPLGNASTLTINEWLANPPPGQPDWVELHNIGNLPVALRGVYLGVTGLVHQVTSLSYIPAQGFAQFFFDEGVGANHLDVRLPASGGTILLYNSAAVEVNRVTYGPQAEGVSQGRLPNGTGGPTTFVGSMSPGSSNYVAVYNGPVLNEVMARNISAITNTLGDASDWFELYNPASTNVDLGGMSLSVDRVEPGQWVIPAGTIVAPNSFLIVWCENRRPASTAAGPYLNTGRNLDGQSGGVYLFNANRQLVNFIEYGFQIEDQSIGRIAGQWRLQAGATPGATNSVAASLGSATNVVFNEWMAQSEGEPDWFELFNPSQMPVDLSGHYVTDDLSSTGINKFRIGALSFIGPVGWVRFFADEDPDAGRDHVNFSLSAAGESLRLYSATSNVVASIYFGPQANGVSEGRLPDGAPGIAAFAGSASPGAANYVLPPGVIFNEVLSHATTPLEDAVELFNPSPDPADIGGWYLSDSPRNFKKVRVPDGTTIWANSHAVLYEYQFNNGSPTAFSLDRSRGNELWLSQADPLGNLTGVRARLAFGPALNGVSFGRFSTRVSTDFVPLAQRTFGVDTPSSVAEFRTGGGLPNSTAKVGPIVINEIMYHPPDIVTPTNVINNTDEEFIELHNISGAAVDLSNWRLSNAVNYAFPAGASLPAGGYLLVVSFSPANDTAALAAFRAAYGLSTSVPIFGPYEGRLDNDRERVELYQPDVPDAGYVPHVFVETVAYTDETPWPAGATDGGGLSMQRSSSGGYGNDPLNWVAADPTPAAANNPPIVPLPVITQHPQTRTNIVGFNDSLSVQATGTGPFSYQWRFNGVTIPGATNATLIFAPVEVEQGGSYDVFVSNYGGSVLSDAAVITIAAPPTIASAPGDVIVRPGTNVTLSVTATGPGPLTYQWYYNGSIIAGATNRMLSIPNVQLSQAGDYEVRVTNPNATVTALGRLIVLVAPTYTQHPQSVTALVGDDVSFRVAAVGTMPMGFRWRRNSINFVPFELGSSVLVVTNVQLTNSGNYFEAVITNRANASPGALSQRATLTVLADSDGDRLPDSWESANGFLPGDPNDAGSDPDGDGMTNLEEYGAGTNPHDANSFLKVEQISVSGVTTLRFFAVSNKNYTVQFSDALGGGWSTLGHAFIRATNRMETMIDSNTVPQRYYRLVTPYQP